MLTLIQPLLNLKLQAKAAITVSFIAPDTMKSSHQISTSLSRTRKRCTLRARIVFQAIRNQVVKVRHLGGVREKIRLSGLFNDRWYALSVGADVGDVDLIAHYLASGEPAGARPNELFDPKWYRETYPDCQATSPLLHYLQTGQSEGRKPGPEFDPQDYLSRYPDVASAGLDPLRHYLGTGRFEGRAAFATQAPIEPGAWFDIDSKNAADEGDESSSSAGFSGDVIRKWRPPNARMVVHILHGGGGGTERYVRDLARNSVDGEYHVVIFTAGGPEGLRLLVIFATPSGWRPIRLRLAGAELLASYLVRLGTDALHIHQSSEILPSLNRVLDAVAIPFELTLHDYSLICPRNSLVDVRGNYCGEPSLAACQKCIQQAPRPRVSDAAKWRTDGIQVLAKAERVLCQTEEAAKRIRKYQPQARVVVAPARDGGRLGTHARNSDSLTVRVGVIGNCSIQKGGNFLLRCVEEGVKQKLDLDWILFGSLEGVLVRRARALQKSLYVTGPYAPDALQSMIDKYHPNIVLFPQHCVETYSYALDEAFVTGLPILAPDLGAFPERMMGKRDCVTYPIDSTPAAVVRQICEYMKTRMQDAKAASLFPS